MKSSNGGPNGGNGAGEFMAGHVGECGDVRVVSLPAVPVAAAQTGRLDGDDDAVN